MNRGIYGAAAGMKSSQDWLDVVANNLANVNTTAFKRDGIQFGDWMERNLRADGGRGEIIGTMGSGPAAQDTYVTYDLGNINDTGRQLDFALQNPRAFFALQGPNGETLYARDGAFERDSAGQLVTREGLPVLDVNRNPIFLDQGTIKVDENGNIALTPFGEEDAVEVAQIGVFFGPTEKVGRTYFRSDQMTPVDSPNLRQGSLEGSNVHPIESMIQMISLNRSYELAQKSISTQDEQTGRLLDALRGN